MSSIELSLMLPDIPVSVGDHVVAECLFKNTGVTPLYFNTRLTLARDVWFTVSFRNERLPFLYKVQPRRMKVNDFRELHGGQIIMASYVLTDGFEIDRKGEFEVTVHYENHATYPGLGRDYGIFSGELVSPAVNLVMADKTAG